MSRIYKELSSLNSKKKNPNHSIRKWAKDIKRHLTEKDIQMEMEHKRYSASLTTRKIQIKTSEGITTMYQDGAYI